ncbi:AraC-like DNA-binding protein [Chryseobacterium sp. SLBN-27]|uniref:helix-turn-helix domain-containing protein n=1 Tax=Chryseobacterium sp. SLBN-27 TaxID=3042287 RepID=UPI002859343B|nr:AraC family transcriptional regulator [Chryseobacterium sp. SLBN-27]MDR6159065.1 AraC-like DNA-binding protein [Chryseobacterium sp. SLBN-27]
MTSNEEIEKLKLELMDKYVILMLAILAAYILVYNFYISETFMSWYVGFEFLFVGYTYFLMRGRFPAATIVHLHLITAPLYNFAIILAYWENSVTSFCWLLPIPLGAYIFLKKKDVFIYIGYILLIIIASYIVANNVSFNFQKHAQKDVIFTDAMAIISNIAVVILLIYYNDKIKRAEISVRLDNFEIPPLKNKKNEKEISPNDIENNIENMEKLFSRIEDSMAEKMLFKDTKFNLAALSVALEVNSTYISKAIRYKGYSNFNTYLNTYRVNHVKRLLSEVDFQKATLMYIYTEAGFSNQPTFNRVFKQIEGITPSEYFEKHHKNPI